MENNYYLSLNYNKIVMVANLGIVTADALIFYRNKELINPVSILSGTPILKKALLSGNFTTNSMRYKIKELRND